MPNKEITDANFINLANNMVGAGLIKTGQSNFELAKDYAKQQSIAFAEWMYVRGYVRSKWYYDRWYIPTNPQIVETNQPSTEQLYELFLQSQN